MVAPNIIPASTGAATGWGGRGSVDDAIKRRMIEKLLEDATGSKPIQHPMQGYANLSSALLLGLEGRADEERERAFTDTAARASGLPPSPADRGFLGKMGEALKGWGSQPQQSEIARVPDAPPIQQPQQMAALNPFSNMNDVGGIDGGAPVPMMPEIPPPPQAIAQGLAPPPPQAADFSRVAPVPIQRQADPAISPEMFAGPTPYQVAPDAPVKTGGTPQPSSDAYSLPNLQEGNPLAAAYSPQRMGTALQGNAGLPAPPVVDQPAAPAAGRGSANYMRPGGAYGDPKAPDFTSNYLTQIKVGDKGVTVHKDAASAFQAFLEELKEQGYDLKDVQGHNLRNIRGSNKLSQHAFGNAIDINPYSGNGFGVGAKTDLPPNVSAMAAKHGLTWGGDWKGRPDPMHFEWTGRRPEGSMTAQNNSPAPQQNAGRIKLASADPNFMPGSAALSPDAVGRQLNPQVAQSLMQPRMMPGSAPLGPWAPPPPTFNQPPPGVGQQSPAPPPAPPPQQPPDPQRLAVEALQRQKAEWIKGYHKAAPRDQGRYIAAIQAIDAKLIEAQQPKHKFFEAHGRVLSADERRPGSIQDVTPKSVEEAFNKTSTTKELDRENADRAKKGLPPVTVMEMKKAGAQNTTINNTVNPVLKGIGESFVETLNSAKSSVQQIDAIHEARRSLEGGAVTGAGADMRLGMKKIGSLFGLSDEEASNTEVFRSTIGKQVLSQAKALGANPSNADREYIEKVVGGQINLEEKSIKRMLDISEKWARNVIKRANSDGKKMMEAQPEEFKSIAPLMSVEEPPEYSAPPPRQAAPTQTGPRPRAVNPQTNEVIEYDGQQWVPVR